MQVLYNIVQDIRLHATSQSLVLLDEVRFKLAWLKFGNIITNFTEKEKREYKLVFTTTLYGFYSFYIC